MTQFPTGVPGASSPDEAYKQAKAALDEGKTTQAGQIAAMALRQAPTHPRLLYVFGAVQQRNNSPTEALMVLRRAQAALPDDLQITVEIAGALSQLGDPDQAIKILDDALAKVPGDPSAISAKARVLGLTGDPEQAYELLVGLVGTSPELARQHAAQLADMCGDLKKYEEGVDLLRAWFGRADLTDRQREVAYFVLGRLLDRLGEYDQAFEAVKSGNALRPSHPSLPAHLVASTWTRARLEATPRATDTSELPVLVVGLPRSGTTLTESILTEHAEIVGVGESPAMSRVNAEIQKMIVAEGGQLGRAMLPQRALTQLDVNRLGSVYLDMARSAAGDQFSRVIDKMPVNFLHIGLASRIMPGVRVVNCIRDPRDVCLSCYFSGFGGKEGALCSDQRLLAQRCVSYYQVMAYWHEVLDIPIYDHVYQDLIEDPEASVRSLLGALGVDYDPACLKFHESKRTVMTASKSQVRQPINRRGLDRWKNYEKHIGPMLEILQPIVDGRRVPIQTPSAPNQPPRGADAWPTGPAPAVGSPAGAGAAAPPAGPMQGGPIGAPARAGAGAPPSTALPGAGPADPAPTAESNAMYRQLVQAFTRSDFQGAVQLAMTGAQRFREYRFKFMAGICLMRTSRPDLALRAFTELSTQRPDDAGLLVQIANAHRMLNKPEQAVVALDQAYKIDPTNKSVLTTRALIQRETGEPEAAIETLKPLVSGDNPDPSFITTYVSLCASAKRNEEGIRVARDTLKRSDLDPVLRENLLFELGNHLDAVGEYDEAFAAFKEANSTIQPVPPADSMPYTKFWTREFLSQFPEASDRTPLPVLIVGMPRSGTTLTDSILVEHSQIESVGEATALGSIVTPLRQLLTSGGGAPRPLTQAEVDRFGGEYLARIMPAKKGDTARVIDKMPGNFLFLGVASKILPGVSVINCMRDARDVCLSQYFQSFVARLRGKTCSPELCARNYLAYVEIMKHWREALNIKMTDFRYQDLIDNTEESLRDLLGFLGLEFEEACLNFHQSKRHVITASLSQVRQPIYRSSLERWRNYEKHIGPMLDLLADV